jgi:hypothetical protein
LSSAAGPAAEDTPLRVAAARLSSYAPADRYVLFELDVERAQATIYENGSPVRKSWKREA